MQNSDFVRSAAVLLHVSSLPSPYGIGSLGADARIWIDFLADAGQRYWQTLPLGPTGFGDSPYQSFCAFAGNPYFIDLDTLVADGLLLAAEPRELFWGRSYRRVDYGTIYRNREKILRLAFSRFYDNAALDRFIAQNPWLPDYCLYMSIKSKEGNRAFSDWPDALRLRDSVAINLARDALSAEIRFPAFCQFLFFRQWVALREYANVRGIQIIGDVPIYVSPDSSDLWANPRLFQLGADGNPTEVAGCPPDAFAKTGQLWGNPLYDWNYLAETGYDWFIRRLLSGFSLFDVLRLDHFRGFESYYAVPYGDKTAENGRWRPGPGLGLINAIRNAIPNGRFIAEDLGFLTDSARRFLAESGAAGMKVLQFAFDSRDRNDYSPYCYTPNSVCYPGTHDNDTLSGWLKTAPPATLKNALDYTGAVRISRLPRALIRLALESASNLAVIPMQDWLGRGSEARMNTPSTVGGKNWRWRLSKKALSSGLAASMRRMTRLYGR